MSVATVTLNGNNQGGFNAATYGYQDINWSGLDNDEGGIWNALDGFIPPAGDLSLDWQCWVSANYGGSEPQIVAKVHKYPVVLVSGVWCLNGVSVDGKASIGRSGDVDFTATTGRSYHDVSDGCTLFKLKLYVNTNDPSVGAVLDGNKAHTYFSCRC